MSLMKKLKKGWEIIDEELKSKKDTQTENMCHKLGYEVIKISNRANITQINVNQNKLTYSERYLSNKTNIEKLQNEIVSFLASKQQQNRTEIFRNINLDQIEIWFGLDYSYCIQIKAEETNLILRFGRISATRSAGGAVLGAVFTGGLALAAGGAIAATRKKFELDFWKFIDGLSWLNNAPVQQINIPVDIPAQIEKIAKLHESGILTKEEYEKKKKELLDKM